MNIHEQSQTFVSYSIKRKTVQKQNRKHRRDNISNKDNIRKRKKNRRFNHDLLTQKHKIKNKSRKENYRNKISEIKANAPDQNAINLSTTTLTEAQKSLLMKGLSFVPTPSDVNWHEMRKDFDRFVNQLRFKARNIIEPNANTTNEVTTNTGTNAPKKTESNIAPLYRTRETNYKSLETFIENMEKDLFNPKNVKTARSNLSKDGKKALKEIKSWDDKVVRVQDKESRFVILEIDVYEEKIQQQIDRSSFKELKEDPSKLFQQKINNWIEKWYAKKVIDNSWKDFISCDSPNAGKMCGLVETHKANNPAKIITSGCNTAAENLSIFVEKVLYKEVEQIPSRIKDTSHMLDIIDNLNDSDLPENSALVSFDVVNMFPSIDNESGVKAVKKVLNDRESKILLLNVY